MTSFCFCYFFLSQSILNIIIVLLLSSLHSPPPTISHPSPEAVSLSFVYVFVSPLVVQVQVFLSIPLASRVMCSSSLFFLSQPSSVMYVVYSCQWNA
ncbi:hypothetical protein BJX68DRAFT_248400 [Aspergillus pseudodeflectus]|uniref:Secreted peptide n=1 Tax=Aspergillus pseudodeflectus TaxID=176178 RepID=A0ABR4JFZ5_9EURO